MSDDYVSRKHPTTTTAPAPSTKMAAVSHVAPVVVTTTPPATTPSTTAAPAPAARAASVPTGIWDSIAACETNGNWAANTGNGYYGGLQFTIATWLRFGGGAYAHSANLASREQQIAVAQRVVAAQGGSYHDWGACASRLG